MRAWQFSGCVLVAMAVTTTAWADRPDGLDVSYWQGEITQAEWNQIAGSGKVFGFCRASAGIDYADSTLADNMSRAAQAGLVMGVYHFAYPQYYSATAEADWFVSVAGAYMTPGHLRPVLDLEQGSNLSTAALSNWANTFMNRVEALTGVEPLIYTNTNYATYELDSSLADRDLWIAQYWTYPDPENGQPNIGIFNNWVFWQWTSHGKVPGIPGDADLNVFNGTLAELENYIIPGGTITPPYIVESRSGGQNYNMYSETGTWSNGASKSSATGTTPGIGHRWCTLGGAATATFRFTPSTTGTYAIFTTNCTTSNSGNPLIHKVSHAGGTTSVGVCQNTTCGQNAVNVWYPLGQYYLYAGTQYTVVLDGSTAAGSGPSGNAGRSDAIKWTLIDSGDPPPPAPHIVESRSGGLNYNLYSETGTWSNGTPKSTASGTTAGIGHRWCVIDGTAKTAVFRYTPTVTGVYKVYT
ncbi:MAG: GH25 family lysozyme, partial [Phycisphaerae bacterium]